MTLVRLGLNGVNFTQKMLFYNDLDVIIFVFLRNFS